MASPHSAKPQPVANSVLAALPPGTYRDLLSGLEPVALVFGDVLYEPGAPIREVYFPTDGLVSLLTLVEGRLALEVGLVGREGMVGVALALGIGVSPIRALVQGGGTALRMSAARFRRELRRSAPLQRELFRYTHSLMAQITQTAACNRFHRVPARLARWLLMTRDRVRSGQFYLTHEFLAHMLGVRRVGVTEAASALVRRQGPAADPSDAGRWSLELLRRLEWRRFEELCTAYYEVAEGADKPPSVVQCKPSSVYTVGIKPVRELRAAMAAAGVPQGVLVACGTFTSEPKEFSRGENIQLIDGGELLRKIAALARSSARIWLEASEPMRSANPTTRTVCDSRPCILRTKSSSASRLAGRSVHRSESKRTFASSATFSYAAVDCAFAVPHKSPSARARA